MCLLHAIGLHASDADAMVQIASHSAAHPQPRLQLDLKSFEGPAPTSRASRCTQFAASDGSVGLPGCLPCANWRVPPLRGGWDVSELNHQSELQLGTRYAELFRAADTAERETTHPAS